MSRTTPAPHGTHSRYASRAHGCRCDACRAAHAATVRAWRKRVARWGRATTIQLMHTPTPTTFRCAGCGGKSSDPAGHPGCQRQRA